jgi:hypothetical protein
MGVGGWAPPPYINIHRWVLGFALDAKNLVASSFHLSPVALANEERDLTGVEKYFVKNSEKTSIF